MQSPIYVEEIRKWMLQILADPNAPIPPFLNGDALRHLAEGKVPVPDMFALYLYERVIQINAWFQDYQVSVHFMRQACRSCYTGPYPGQLPDGAVCATA